jgi:hypothetical protein
MRDENIRYQFRNELFLVVIHRFSLVKAAMNAPFLCELSKDCLTGTGHGAMVFTKRLNFLIFQLPESSQRTGARKMCSKFSAPLL